MPNKVILGLEDFPILLNHLFYYFSIIIPEAFNALQSLQMIWFYYYLYSNESNLKAVY
jgi:hypothetical protein